MNIQLIVLAPNHDLSSNERKKSKGANKMFTNKYCIPSKNDVIIVYFILLFYVLEFRTSKNKFSNESFLILLHSFLNKYYIYSHKSIKYPYDNKCF